MSGPSIWPAYLIFGTCSCFSSSCGPIVYSKAITAWFDKERGLALGLATAGVGLGTAILPLVANYLISHFGWRLGYVGIALMTWVIAGSMISLFIREPSGYLERLRDARDQPQAGGSQATGPQPPNRQPLGLSFRAAVTGTRQFWILAAIFIAVGTANNGSLGHLVAMLIDRGYTPGEAAGILSSTGLAAFVARIAFGFCLDRLAGPRLAAVIMLLPACGLALLWSGWGGSTPLIAAILCGLGNGAEVDLLGFFVSRYFGRRSFGALYGMIFSCFTIGIGIGPAILGHNYDATHSYEGTLLAFVFVLLAAGALFLTLGRYNYPKGTE
jgi:MFS family permease